MEMPYAAVTVVAGLLSATAGAIAAGRRGQARRARWPFLTLCAAGAIWGVTYGVYLLVDDLAYSRFALRLVWVGAAPFAPLWFLFVAGYVDDGRWFSRRVLTLLFAVPAVVVLAAATSQSHELLLAESGTTTVLGYQAFAIDLGPLFYVYVAYASWLLAASAARLCDVAIESGGVNRRAVLALTAATLVPISTLLTLPLELSVAPTIDLTPAALGAANVLVLLALTHYGLFDPGTLSRRRLFDETGDAVLAVGTDGQVTTANPAARETFGDDVVGTPLSVLANGNRGLIELAVGARRRASFTVADGDESRYMEVTGTSLGDGSVSHGRLLVFQDVTEQRRLSTAFSRVVEVTSDVVTVVDGNEIAYASPTASDTFGYSPATLAGEPFRSFVHPEDREDVESALRRATETGESIRVSHRFQHHDGGWRTVESVVVDLRDDPAISGHVLTTRDVTDQQKREQRLRVLNRTLRHDLRNDMNVVLGYIDRYLDGDGDVSDLQHARDRAADLFELGERAREMDRVLGREEDAPVDLQSIVADSAEQFRDRHPDATLHVDDAAACRIPGDSGLDLTLRHLFENAAVHHDRDDPTIWVDVDASDADGVRISVADDGPGIPDAELSVLRSGTETPLEHGSGVGLWLVQWLVENAGGEVTFENSVTRGTVVSLTLPTVDTESESADGVDDAGSPVGDPTDHGAVGATTADRTARTANYSWVSGGLDRSESPADSDQGPLN